MILDCAHYKDGARQDEDPLAIDEAAERARGDGFIWLGLHDPEPGELSEVAAGFDLPPLAVEDALKAHQRPKLENYGDGYFLVLHTARYLDDVEEVEFGEVHVFAGAGFVIVVRHGAASELASARERLEARPELLREGPAAAVWAIMDKIVDDYEPVMAGLENDVEEVEVDVFGERSDETKRIYFLRRELAEFYRAVHPLLLPLDLLVSAEHPKAASTLGEHLRDVSDHVRRIEDAIGTQRELLTSVLQANLAVIAMQQNDAVKKISGWAAIITVPTLIASIYGMNFDYMPELHWQAGYPLALAMMVAAGLILHRLLRRADWL
ncbi:MAG TPA: magnesium and cobalt transport protein CorA [Solirubrobacteraceae bacterium]|nr:magnesium and cobalt transport protein CorA [Solirubrobacteraceae bacterium]